MKSLKSKNFRNFNLNKLNKKLKHKLYLRTFSKMKNKNKNKDFIMKNCKIINKEFTSLNNLKI
jgi:hypothetical protein